MNPCCTVLYITSIACGVFQCMSEDEIELLAASLTQLGDTLATMLIQEGLNHASCETASLPTAK